MRIRFSSMSESGDSPRNESSCGSSEEIAKDCEPPARKMTLPLTETQKALDLHDEIVKAMLEKNVDPFERSYRLGNDPVILDVTRKAPELLQGTISLKYWREFSSNRKHLETISAEKTNPTTSLISLSASSLKKKKKETAKTKTKTQSRSQKLQDVRQPSAQLTCSFAAPPAGFPLFDSHIIGPKNPVQKLIEDTHRRDGTGTTNSSNNHETAAILSPPTSPAPLVASVKRLSKPLVTVSGDVGTPLPGGVMNQGRAREPQPIPLTAGIPFPSGQELDGSKKNALGGPFLSSQRFPLTASLSKSAHTAAPPQPNAALTAALSLQSDKHRGRFSTNPRFSEASQLQGTSTTPNPGSYKVLRLFDELKPKLTSERSEELIRQIQRQNEQAIRSKPCVVLSEKAVFGYGCSLEEHVRYGMCLDGQCARRANWEDVTLLLDDQRRITGGERFSAAERAAGDDGKSVSSAASVSSSAGSLSRDKGTILPDFSPLKAAAMSGDIDTVIKLCSLGTDINEVDREMGRCALHHCSSRNLLSLVNFISGGSSAWQPQSQPPSHKHSSSHSAERAVWAACERLFRGVVNLDIRDRNGDTPLHLASRLGYQEIVEALCDAGAEGNAIRNNKNESAADIARTQAIFQTIQLVSAKREAERELETLRCARLRSQKSQGSQRQRERQQQEEGEEQGEQGIEDEGEREGEPIPGPLSGAPRVLSSHSFRIGYLPPEREPPPFAGNYKTKKTKAKTKEKN